MDLARITEILEEMDDQVLAVDLLKDFNQVSADYHKTLMNLDKSLSNDEWKKQCDDGKKTLDELVKKILSYSS